MATVSGIDIDRNETAPLSYQMSRSLASRLPSVASLPVVRRHFPTNGKWTGTKVRLKRGSKPQNLYRLSRRYCRFILPMLDLSRSSRSFLVFIILAPSGFD